MAQDTRDSQTGPKTGEDGGDGKPQPVADQAANEQSAPKRRWFTRQGDEQAPRSRNCVLMGPTAAGKTLLLMSLDRCADALSHSYTQRYNATIGRKDAGFERIEGLLDRYFERGLAVEATETGTCFLPEFTLRISAAAGRSRHSHDTRFRTFEGAGGLLEAMLAAKDPALQECRRKLDGALQECDTVLLCLPIIQPVRDAQEKGLKAYLDLFIDQRHIRQLVVCFTMYEALALQPEANLGRHAYRLLANRTAAREQMAWALGHQLSALNNVLRQFHARDPGRKVWCVPVSTYGFVPGNGGANVARVASDGKGRIDEILRTRPASRDAPPDTPMAERPYAYHDALKKFWQPFLTLDPFIFIATGDRDGTLIHAYQELWT